MAALANPPGPGADLSFKQLVNAILYKCKYSPDQLSELTESELSSLDRKLHIAASAVRGSINSAQKINQLPPELLLHILSLARYRVPITSFLPDLSAYEDHGREWYSLLHVCRHWRGIVARSPMMWVTVDNTLIENDAVGERYLFRSGAAPLTVYLGVKDTKIRRRSLSALLKHISRIKEFHLTADLWEEDSSITPIYDLFVDPAPSLYSLSIRTDGKDIIGGVLPPLFNGEMPQLRELTLEHFSTWPANYFTNLTSLCLSDQPSFNRPTTQAFLAFLEESPMLEVLALVRAGPTLSVNTDSLPPAPTNGDGNRIVRFNHMRQVNLGGWPTPSTISRFLSYISLPPQTHVYIWGSIFSNPDMDLKTLLPSDTAHLDNVQGITKWYLTHYSVAQPGDLLYVPFTAIVSSESESDNSDCDSSSAHSSLTNALHTYGVFRSSHLLSTLRLPTPIYPFHNITSFILRDSSYQANRFTTAVWVEIFGKLEMLKELRILAYQATTTTRSVLSALMPMPVSKEREGSEMGDNDDADSDDDEEPRLRPGTSIIHRSASLSKSNYRLLCPNLSTLGVEHDPDLASIFITKLAKARKKHGCPIEKLCVLVYDPDPRYGGGGGGGPSSPRRSRHSATGADNDPNSTNPNPNGNLIQSTNIGNVNVYASSSTSTLSSREILNEEYHLRSKEDEELLRRYVREVRFEYRKPLSQDLVPKGWPTDAYRRTCLPYSF